MTATSDLAPLLEETRRHFPGFGDAKISPIEKGGSDRRFYRISSSGADSFVLVQYNLERAENRHYVRIAELLAEHEIRAPKIFFHDPKEGLIWIEDLGERDLWSYRNESWATRRPLYESALAELSKLHGLPESAANEMRADLPPGFDAALYLWEQQYFLENCLGRHFGIDERSRAELSELPALHEIAAQLAQLPRVLLHRDFQSQNIIIRERQAYLIDFQGMRSGVPDYDLASLLYDPYVPLLPAERAELLGIYRQSQTRGDATSREDADAIFRLCAMQRLMQALGAFGYLGLVKGHRTFLNHIPAAMKSLRELVDQISALNRLSETLRNLD